LEVLLATPRGRAPAEDPALRPRPRLPL